MKRDLTRLSLFVVAVAWCAATPYQTESSQTGSHQDDAITAPLKASTMQIHYLEIVTPDVEQTCATLERQQGITFSAPVPELGNARTASMKGGGEFGVRGPLRPDETPVVRPYRLVEDLAAAVKHAEANGATIALPSMEIPGRGKIAIYIQGGIEHGLWQK